MDNAQLIQTCREQQENLRIMENYAKQDEPALALGRACIAAGITEGEGIGPLIDGVRKMDAQIIAVLRDNTFAQWLRACGIDPETDKEDER